MIGEFDGPLSPLAEPAFVARVSINEMGTIAWPGELDLDPIVLYCAVKGIPVPSYDESPSKRRDKAARGGRAGSQKPSGARGSKRRSRRKAR